LRILAGELEASAGTYEYGHNVKVGYYAQHHAETLAPEASIYETINAISKNGHKQVRAALGALLFRDDDVEKKVGVLSGGERARVALARLLVDPGNLLLMDEPTNHLDLQSSDRLAEALASYEGTLLFVSHNRAFIRAIATAIWTVENGTVEVYPGTFDEYLDSCRMRAEEERAPEAAPTPKAAASPSPKVVEPKAPKLSRVEEKARTRAEAERRKERIKKLTPLERRAKELEHAIEPLEKEIHSLARAMEDPTVYGDEPKRLEVTREMARKQAELDV